VEAAADLGAPIPSYSVVTFHDALYDVMQIRARAHTVSQMFVRLGGSIRSELTAIESRERQQEEARRREAEQRRLDDERHRQDDEDRRFRTATAFGVVSFVAVPLGFILAFFGINARQIHLVYGRSTIRRLPQLMRRRPT
jgi:hypothetical protein